MTAPDPLLLSLNTATVRGEQFPLAQLGEDRAEMRTKGKSHKLKGHKKKDGKKA